MQGSRYKLYAVAGPLNPPRNVILPQDISDQDPFGTKATIKYDGIDQSPYIQTGYMLGGVQRNRFEGECPPCDQMMWVRQKFFPQD